MKEDLNEQLGQQLNQQLETLDKVQDAAITSAVHYGPKVLIALIILVMGVYAGR